MRLVERSSQAQRHWRRDPIVSRVSQPFNPPHVCLLVSGVQRMTVMRVLLVPASLERTIEFIRCAAGHHSHRKAQKRACNADFAAVEYLLNAAIPFVDTEWPGGADLRAAVVRVCKG